MSDEALATDRPPERESDAPPEALMEQGLEGLVNQPSEYQRHNIRCFAIGARWIDRGDGAVAGPQGALNARWTRRLGNLRSSGRATALFASLTLSRSLLVLSYPYLPAHQHRLALAALGELPPVQEDAYFAVAPQHGPQIERSGHGSL